MPLNIDNLAEDVGLERDEYLELLELYLEVTPGELDRAKEALSRRNAEELARAAHSLKGSSGNIRLMELNRRALDLETASRDGELARAKGCLDSLIEGFEEVRAKAAALGLAGQECTFILSAGK